MRRQTPEAEMYKSDIRAWEDMLEDFSRENTMLKNTLATAVDNIDAKAYIDMAEKFNSLFIIKDECISDLKKDIETHKTSLNSGLYLYPEHNKTFLNTHKKLRNEMENFKSGIFKLKERFNNYLSSQ